jgi:hypothetical protein
VKSVPSSWYEFSEPAEPSEVERESPVWAWLTPGAALIRSKKVKRGTGALRTQSLS